MSKHTKGPWTRKIIDDYGPQTELWAGGKLMATIYGAATEEGAANACLFHAAPDLLVACRMAKAIMATIGLGRTLLVEADEYVQENAREAFRACDAAIAAAEEVDDA